MDIIQLIGYVGSVLVAVSLSMKNILKLRWINLFGAVFFSIYGFLVEAYPVMLLNAFISFADIYYLLEIYKKHDSFDLVKTSPNDEILLKFIDYHKSDIQKFFPDFSELSDKVELNTYFILRNSQPAGIIIFKQISKLEIKIILDYAAPAYRDYKNAEYFNETAASHLKEIGISKVFAETKNKIHMKYLQKMGYLKDNNNSDLFVLNLQK